MSVETILLKLDEMNELLFGVKIQGARNSNSVFRIVCECRGGMELMFQGTATPEGDVKFNIPPLQEFMEPCKSNVHLEVIVDNKVFVPMQLIAEFKQGTSVVAESVNVVNSMEDDDVPVTSARLLRVGDTKVNETRTHRTSRKPKKALTLRALYDAQKGK